MLMAAGLGTRLRPFTEMCTKALVPVMGVPVAQFAVDLLVRGGVKNLVANIHHRPEQARSGLEALDRGKASLAISDESAQLLGSAGGYRKALPLLGSGPFFALNADVLCDVDLDALFHAHQRLRARSGVALTLAVLRQAPPGEKYRRIVVDPASSLVTGVQMDPEESPPFWAGVAVLEPEALAGVPDGPAEFIPSILKPALERGKVGAHLFSGAWFDVGSPELWLRAHLALIDGLETGAIPRDWRTRIERSSHRLAQGQWVSNHARRVDNGGWEGPCYFGGETKDAPRMLGPEAVLYGRAPEGKLARGIAYGGEAIEL
jgi:MurNAc alpha-1-phosphate uridylyltransferase